MTLYVEKGTTTCAYGLTMFPFRSHNSYMRTRGDMLRFAVAFALRGARKIVRGLKKGLTEEERYAVADRTVEELKRYGDPWGLNEDIKREGPGQPPSPMQNKWTP